MKTVVCMIALLAAVPAASQNPDRLPWIVVDAHAATVGLPQAEGWVPDVAADSNFPGRNWGLSVGATAYPFRLGIFTVGVGASIITGKGAGEAVTITSSNAPTRITPVVHTSITTLAPQVSMNFGRKLGWSYISAGLGRTKVTSFSEAVGSTPGIDVPEVWSQALNFGGGARWFMKPHLGAGFDMRFVKLGSRSATATVPSARRTQMWNISAGISIQ